MGLLELVFPKKCFGCKKEGLYICRDCLSKVPRAGTFHPRLVSLWEYKGVIKKAVISLKYKFASEVAEELGKDAVLEIKRRFPTLPKNTGLVPIPLHWRRENWRGFNQSAVLGKIIAKEMSWQFIPDLLIKRKATTPQVRLKGDDRRKNIRGVFVVNPRYVLSTMHSVLIFDDVWTTGSTIKEAAKTLKKAGVKEIWGLTITKGH